MPDRARRLLSRSGRQLRDAVAALFDQQTPFGRLASTHVLMTAGDTLLTISLAGSLFFSISPKAATHEVLLYLLLTMAPFAVVAPLLGPVIDRSRGARRAVVVFSAAARVVICLFMARDIHSLLLFPEAFLMLVLSKVYLITKGSIVPLLAQTRTAAPRTVTLDDGAPQTSTASGSAPSDLAPSTTAESGASDGPGGRLSYGELATLNARLGLLASLTGFVAALPAVVVLKLLSGAWVLRLDAVVFVAATIAAARLPLVRSAPSRAAHEHDVTVALSTEAGSVDTVSSAVAGPVGGPTTDGRGLPARGPAARAVEGEWARRERLGRFRAPLSAHPEVTLALSAMSVLKAVTGFVVFLLAFDLRRMHAATWWFGFVLAASVVGAVIGVLLVPRMRRVLSEPHMLACAVCLVAAGAVLAAFVGGLLAQAALALFIGVAGASGKPAFDALVQHHVPTASQGRAFARYETRLQLAWVLGSLVPVIVAIPLRSGDIVIAAVAAVAVLSYLTGRRALRPRSADHAVG